MTRFLGSLVVGVLLLSLVGCNKQLPTGPSSSITKLPAGEPRSSGPLAFVSTRDGGAPYIYVANSDGSNATKLVAGEKPAWSPDGARIAFQRGSSAAPDVCVMNVDGSGLQVLGKGGSPAWSPDGRLAVQDSGSRGIAVMNADGSSRTVFVRPGFRSADDFLATPIWSPDGQSIGFVAANNEDPNQIYVATAGAAPHALIGGPNVSTQSDPVWSADGSTVAFIGYLALWTVRADGSGLQSRINDEAYEPDFGPDGQFVFGRFLSGQGVGSPMRIFVGIGASTRQLVPNAPGVVINYWDYQPAWSRR